MMVRLGVGLALVAGAAGASAQHDHETSDPALPQAAAAASADRDAMIADALSAAPPQVAATARVVAMDGTVLREGSGPFTCMATPPGMPEGARSPMCLDEEWLAAIRAYGRRDASYRPSRIGIAYMLAGDNGSSNVDPFAAGPSADNQWIVEGPHLMVIQPDPAALEGLPTDPHHGGPYVMWAGTPFVHVMIPTAPRPARPER